MSEKTFMPATQPPPGSFLFGQFIESNGTKPSFEVESIKLSRPEGNSYATMSFDPNDGLVASDATLKDLIQFAYGIKSDDQLEGLSGWMISKRYDVNAQISNEEQVKLRKSGTVGETVWEREFQLMLQSLLADRFGLTINHTHKEASIYKLVVAKGGMKMKQVDDLAHPEFAGIRGGGVGKLTGTATSMDLFARVLSTQRELGNSMYWGGGRLVVNDTKLTGKYDWTLEWTPDLSIQKLAVTNPSDANGPSLFTALQEQLGLKLISAKGPVEVLVIDHANMPSPN